ncbi:helix-turn-helix domain-containing protein [Enterococcus alcedinis]|uniref:AraC family transcriptional regulator n=1 Tax=Enterococcus alcedinis TaxID=1274384 RepID=A0A917JFL9_9ENTE|nr:helix-turn-helix domain-containing protein [Enterococcus alcedinis]MBP2102806.1 AraC-like DNA-binding protein [Enterococcus alcedinis]GGI66368.1 AraC family transcriptional regulator [Enterococcus alcedinis]
MKWIKKLNILQYSIFSYILFFAIIFVPMSLIWYSTSKHSVTQQLELSSKNTLLQAKTNFESDLNQLDLLSQQLPYDTSITLKQLSDPFESIKSRSALAKYRLNSNFVEEVYVFFPEDKTKLYSPSGSTDLSILLNNWQATLSEEAFIEQMDQVTPTFSVMNEGNPYDKFFLYTVPTQDTFGKNTATMIYSIRKSSIDAAFAPLAQEPSGSFFLVNAQNQIFDFSGRNIDFAKVLNEKLTNSKEIPSQFNWQRDQYLLHHFENKTLNLNYYYAVNTNFAVARLTQIYKASIYAIVCILIVGLFSSVFLGRKSYQPYEKIELLLRKHGKMTTTNKRLTFEDMQRKVSTFLSENTDLKEAIQQQQPYIKETILHQLLMNSLMDSEATQQLFSEKILLSKETDYFTLILSLEVTEDSPVLARDSFSQQLLYHLNHLTMIDSTELIGTIQIENQLVLLVAFNRYSSQEFIVQSISDSIIQFCGIALPLGVGQATSDIQMVRHSYIEALTALNHRYTNNHETIFYFKEITEANASPHNDFQFPKDLQLKLIQSLQLGNEMVALETLKDLIQYGSNNSQSFHIFRLYSGYLISTYAEVGTQIIGEQLLNDFEHLMNVTDFPTLESQLQAITKIICEKVERDTKTEENLLKDALFSYIHENFHSDTLSLESTADHFNLSSATINKIMKEGSDTTFAKYIAHLRLEQIKEDLIQTNLPIKEIIQNNGYYDVSNFTRKFRTTVGVTPGQYRTINREAQA